MREHRTTFKYFHKQKGDRVMSESVQRMTGLLKRISRPTPKVPNPEQDFGMYEKMREALQGVTGYLEGLRRNQGRVGYSAQNLVSDLSNAVIEDTQLGDDDQIPFHLDDLNQLVDALEDVSDDGGIAEAGNKFTRTCHQEALEAVLVYRIWPVIIGKVQSVPGLMIWGQYHGNVQAFLYGYLDTVTELAKLLTKELSRPDLDLKGELTLFENYLAIAESMLLRLAWERHSPGYVINNGFSRWSGYTNKIRRAEGAIANIRRDYNLRLFHVRLSKNGPTE